MRFDFEATGIGSAPFRDPKEACRIIFDNFRDIPFWPQLSRRSYLENMYVQFSENLLPGLVLDENSKTIHVDTSKVAGEIERIYNKYVDGDLEFFSVSKDRAQGLYEFMDYIKAAPTRIKFIKGQVTGPVSYALALTDQNKKSIIYDKDLFEILAKTLAMKARWQIKAMKKYFPNVILFLDEPYLVSIGSSYINIDISLAAKKLDEVVDAVKKEGALAGIHCCGNTDWPIILKRDIDILSFDAYNFMKEFSLYGAEIKNFLARGGTIAWGIVPSSDAIDQESKPRICERLEGAFKILADKGMKKDDISSIVTPSCGVGTLDEERAKKILELTSKIRIVKP